MKTVGVVDYGMGNLPSVVWALERAGARAVVGRTPASLKTAEALVIPGVGAFGTAMAVLERRRLVTFLKKWVGEGKPDLYTLPPYPHTNLPPHPLFLTPPPRVLLLLSITSQSPPQCKGYCTLSPPPTRCKGYSTCILPAY